MTGVELTAQERAALAHMHTAFAGARAAFEPFAEVLTLHLRQVHKTLLAAAVLRWVPRHTEPPEPGEVRVWLGELPGRREPGRLSVYGVPEWAMRRTRDIGVPRGDRMALRYARRRKEERS